MKAFTKLAALVAITLLSACSTPPPKAPVADGEIVPANDQKSLEELVRAAVAAANPKANRFTATRGESLRDVLIRWTQQDKTRLFYQTTFNPVLTGAINEPDVRAAAVSLSILLQHEPRGAMLDFNRPGALIVKEFSKD